MNLSINCFLSLDIDCIDYVTGIGNLIKLRVVRIQSRVLCIQAPGTPCCEPIYFQWAAVGQQATENGQLLTLQLENLATGQHLLSVCPMAWLKL